MSDRLRLAVAFGECMVELRSEGGTQMRRAWGGDTLNTAVYLARLAYGRFSVGYATRLGLGDPFSKEMLADWKNEGIDTTWTSVDAARLPGLYAIEVDALGERRFHYWRSESAARHYFDDAQTPLEARAGEIDLFHLSGISLAILDEVARQRVFRVMDAVRAHGGRVAFDNNYRPHLWRDKDAANVAYAEAFARTDIALITLDDELARQGGTDVAAALAGISALPCAEKVVKRGAQPVLVFGAGAAPLEIAVPRVACVVDTTAAGDSFAAGYLAARLEGLAAERAAAAGNRLAGAVIGQPGAIISRNAMPPRSDATDATQLLWSPI